MFKVTLPTNTLYASAEQLANLLSTLAETRYVTKSGEFIQTTSEHELVVDSTTATLLIKQPLVSTRDERDQYEKLWKNAKHCLEMMEIKFQKLEAMLEKKGKKNAKRK